MMIKIPGVFKFIFPEIIWNIKDQGPSLYLTFDDGPTPEVTNAVLSILKNFNAKGTFFCIGRNAERHPDLYNEILSSDHKTGNHTYSHIKGWYTANNDYFNDINLAAQFVPSDLFRPAYGMISPSQLKYLKQYYKIVLWSIMSYDFDYKTSKEKCLNNVLKYAASGSIIVFHDSLRASEKALYALPRVLEYFSEKGFSFNSLS